MLRWYKFNWCTYVTPTGTLIIFQLCDLLRNYREQQLSLAQPWPIPHLHVKSIISHSYLYENIHTPRYNDVANTLKGIPSLYIICLGTSGLFYNIGFEEQINFPIRTHARVHAPHQVLVYNNYSKLRNTAGSIHSKNALFCVQSSRCLHCVFNTVGSSIDILQIENLPTYLLCVVCEVSTYVIVNIICTW